MVHSRNALLILSFFTKRINSIYMLQHLCGIVGRFVGYMAVLPHELHRYSIFETSSFFKGLMLAVRKATANVTFVIIG